ncbi:MAG: LytR C-terminal domain-containing protein [Humibacillus sp.]|nr:LytR C-terminal domain-containing protein [Humibacillus sp.]MDN5779889.1 LytR C-terminal domain-containing protein [Humibacillus sp.]
MTETQHRAPSAFRVRRQRRSTVVVIVVLLGLAAAFYYASSYFRETAPVPVPCTTVAPVVPLKPADVSLNVYNATNRTGLAGATAKVAAKRGFKVKKVANDPKNATIKASAQIRYGPTGAASAKVVQARVPGSVLVKDKRKDDSVDLVIGNGWKKFGPEPPAPIVTQGAPQCRTVTVTGS